MPKAKKPQQKFLRYLGLFQGPPDLSSRRGFETGPERRIEKPSSQKVRRKGNTESMVGMDSVYLLYHLRKEDPESDTQLLLIGAYRSEDDAKAAIERLKSKPGFAKYPDGFEYHAYALGVENWSDGF
ncbi:MAG: hypothetical protein WCC22_13250 [Terriglobales bacterium]